MCWDGTLTSPHAMLLGPSEEDGFFTLRGPKDCGKKQGYIGDPGSLSVIIAVSTGRGCSALLTGLR